MANPRISFISNSNKVVQLHPEFSSTRPHDSLLNQPEVFRQKRADNATGQLSLLIGKEHFRLLNWSRTGIGFEVSVATNPFPVGLKVGPTKIFVGKTSVFSGDIEIKSVRKSSDNVFNVGAEFKSNLFLVEGIESAIRAQNCLDEILNHESEMQDVNPEVCKLIVAMGSSLQILKETCDEQEARLKDLTYDEREECLKVFLPSVTDGVGEVIRGYNRKLAGLLDIDRTPEGSIYHRLFEEHIYPLFKDSEFPRRAVEKPRGYAGDYEMMNQLYRNGYEGDTLFAKVLHGYMVTEDTGDSVRFRKPYFIGHMESMLDQPGNKSLLSLACGPAIEIQELISRWPQNKLDRVYFHLLDLDRKALDHAQTKIMEESINQNKSPNIEFINTSVKSLLVDPNYKTDALDLIYSGGLFDYLDQLTSKMLIQSLFKMLKPGGKLVIGNFHKSSTSKGFLHILFQWHLIHRTEDEMREWANGLEATDCRFDYDNKKINAFIVITKK
jgi:extracellular factor (EF) 3-hydroxypalmitic acid methyl ester biosynthesis protein